MRKNLFAIVLSVVLVLSMTTVAMFSVFASEANNNVVEPATDEITTEATTADETEVTEPVETEPTTAEPAPAETTEAPAEEDTTEAATDESTTAAPEVVGMVGDLNGDAKVNSADARLVLRMCAKLEPGFVQDSLKCFVADANGDGIVKSEDARQILRKAAKLSLSDEAAARLGKSVVVVEGVTVEYDIVAE